MIGAGPAVIRLQSVHRAAAVDSMGGADPSGTPRRGPGAARVPSSLQPCSQTHGGEREGPRSDCRFVTEPTSGTRLARQLQELAPVDVDNKEADPTSIIAVEGDRIPIRRPGGRRARSVRDT